MTFDETLGRWRERLFLSQMQLASEPLDAVTKQREVVGEIEHDLAGLSERTMRRELLDRDQACLEGALLHARVCLGEGELVRARFVSESHARKVHYNTREIAAAQSKQRRSH